MKKLILFILLITSFLFSVNVVHADTGWVKEGDVTYFYKSDGTKATGFQTINGKKYYFYSTGGMAEGWLGLPGNRTYYFNGDGTAATGWKVINDKKYYFYSTGGMAKGWLDLPGKNRIYYLNSDGTMAKGFKSIDNETYYFFSTGGMAKGWLNLPGDRTYYLKTNGTMATGFQSIDGQNYYFFSTGGMAEGWLNLPDNRKYYLSSDGTMVTGLQTIDSNKYYLGSDGNMRTGWIELSGKKHYFKSDGPMAINDITLNGKKYSFYSDGALKSATNFSNYNSTLSEMVNTNLNLGTPGQTDKYNNVPAYIHGDYLSVTSNDVVNGDGVAIRTNPNDSSTAAVYTRVDSGTKVSVVDDNISGFEYQGSTRWYKVRYDNNELYVHSLLIDRGNKVGVTTTRVNVRETPSGHIFATVNENSSYSVIDDSSTWVKVDFSRTWRNAKPEDIAYYVNPDSFDEGSKSYYQFLDLSQSTGISVDQLNNKILYNKEILKDKGQAFIDASNKYNVNELYLISHALLETGNGSSTLANGVLVEEVDGVAVEPKVTYNMYGTGAYDGCALKCGSEYAYKQGWFTPEAAIIGGAKFIGERYINHSSYQQDTLYKMRWNPNNPGSHQYATDIGWASKQVYNLYNMYQMLDYYALEFDIPVYKN